MVDDKSTNLQMPLPHPSNLLGEDVLRLIEALTIADAAIKALQTAVATANQTLASHGHSAATTATEGFMSPTDKTKLDGIASGANAYTHPAAHPPSIITQDANNRFMTDAERQKLAGIASGATSYSHPASHPPSIIEQDENNLFMTSAERQKLDGLPPNPNSNPTWRGNILNEGSMRSAVVDLTSLSVDCTLGNYFRLALSASAALSISNAPAEGVYGFTLEVTRTAGVVTWPTSVTWPGGVAPTLTTGKTHLFMFVTADGGARWRGGCLPNFVS